MKDVADRFADAVHAILSDRQLRESFVRILSFREEELQEKLAAFQQKLAECGAPADLLEFVEVLKDETVARVVLSQLQGD